MADDRLRGGLPAGQGAVRLPPRNDEERHRLRGSVAAFRFKVGVIPLLYLTGVVQA